MKTLGDYRKMAISVFGRDSKAVEFLNHKIAHAPDKENEEVVADEWQMIQVLLALK